MRNVFILLLILLTSCKTIKTFETSKSHEDLLKNPIFQEILNAEGIGSEKLKEVFCKQDPTVRLFLEFEIGDTINLPKDCN